MTVKRIVADLQTSDPQGCAQFYRDLFGFEVAMDAGFLVTLADPGRTQPIQLSLASEGGSGTPVPALSIEVDALDPILTKIEALGLPIEYGPVVEPWGVVRVFVRDPAGALVNILAHQGVPEQT